MARKFWEKLNNNRIQFYDEPADFIKADLEAELVEAQSILALPDNLKMLLAGNNPGFESEDDFTDHYEGIIADLAERLDYYDHDTVDETVTVITDTWLSPADAKLGPAIVVDVCGEEATYEAVNAIDGANGTQWRHDANEVHVLTFDWGYKKRFNGMRFSLPATSPNVRMYLTDFDLRIAGNLNGLDDPANEVITGGAMAGTETGDVDFMFSNKNGRYVRLTVNATAHTNNNVRIREILLQAVARTAGL